MAMLEDFKAQRKIHVRFATQIVLSTEIELRQQASLVDVHVPDEASFTVCGVSASPARPSPSQTGPKMQSPKTRWTLALPRHWHGFCYHVMGEGV